MQDANTFESSVLDQSRKDFENARKQVFFVDSSVPGYEVLVAGLGERGKIFTINGGDDALAQIAAGLESVGGDVDGVHIYSHGRDGALSLGGTWVDAAQVDYSADILRRIGNALTTNADILLYGCNVAKTSVGQSFVERIAQLTQADVAASLDATGNKTNWKLETNVGAIETAPVQPSDWQGTLGGGNQQWGFIESEGARPDHYVGFYSNDILHSTIEGDTLEGAEGNDLYYVDANNVKIIEYEDGGTDTVISRISNFVLDAPGGYEAQIERIDLQAQTGMLGQNAKGNEYTKIMVGNSLANNLTAGHNKGGVSLNGGAGNDYLDAGTGELSAGLDESVNKALSTMAGGTGNDSYIVRHSSDKVVEEKDQGTDHVLAYVNYTLADNVENLTVINAPAKKIVGTGNALNNVLRSTYGYASLSGGAGNDTLYAAKNDRADTLVGGDGNDVFYIYKNGDKATGGAGTDLVYSWVSHTLEGSTENLTLKDDYLTGVGNDLNNKITGLSTGTNTLSGGKGNDTLTGGSGDDSLSGGDGNDSLVGNNGDDTLDGGSGADTMNGGKGNDVYYVDNAKDVVVEAKDQGNDTVYTYGVNITLGTTHGYAEYVENLSAGKAVTMTGTTYTETLIGNSGNDVIDGQGGSDYIEAGAGNDIIHFYGNEIIDAGDGSDTLVVHRSVDEDILHDVTGYEAISLAGATANTRSFDVDASAFPDKVTITGNAGNNSITGSYAADRILGGGGKDTINAGGGNDYVEIQASTAGYGVIDGGEGTDTLNFGSANDSLTFNTNGTVTHKFVSSSKTYTQTVTAKNFEFYYGGSGNDVMSATAYTTAISMDGGAGNDSIAGGSGHDLLRGDAGNDTLVGNNGNDKLEGGAGNDSLVGGKGNDTLNGGAGDDIMNGGAGNDLYYIDTAKDRIIEAASGGTDTIKSNGINIDLNSTLHANVEVIENIHASKGISVIGTSANQTITGNAGNDTIDGKGGADKIVAGAGNDSVHYYGTETIDGGAGKDTLYAHANVTINANVANFEDIRMLPASANAASYTVNAASATAAVSITGNAGNNNIAGSKFNDSIVGSGGKDTINAGSGNDFVQIQANYNGYGAIDGGAGTDTLSFGTANDTITFNANGTLTQKVVSGSSSKNITITAKNFEYYNGGAGNDSLNASANTTGIVLDGGAGNDVLIGGSGNDTLWATGGNDTITTGKGRDAVKITTAAVNAIINVQDFDVNNDYLDESALGTGWTRTIGKYNSTTKTTQIVWTNKSNTTQKITVNLLNVTNGNAVKYTAEQKYTTSQMNLSVYSGDTVTCSTATDKITVNVNNGNALYLNTGGGQSKDTTGRDTVQFNLTANTSGKVEIVAPRWAESSSHEWTSHARFYVGAENATTTPGAALNFTTDKTTDGKTSAVMTSISVGNYKATNTEIYGFSRYYGTSGADTVHAENITSRIEFETHGGDDQFYGGSADNTVHVSKLSDNTRMTIDGGTGISTPNYGGGNTYTVPASNLLWEADENPAVGGKSYHIYSVSDSDDGSGYQTIKFADLSGNVANGEIKVKNIKTYGYSVKGTDGNDVIAIGERHVSTGENPGFDFSFHLGTAKLEGGNGNDTYRLQASGYGDCIIDDTAGKDTVQFFGISGDFDLGQVYFSVGNFENRECLYISNVQGGESDAWSGDRLRFFVNSREAASMEFYTGSTANSSNLSASIDLTSVYDAIKDRDLEGAGCTITFDSKGKAQNVNW